MKSKSFLGKFLAGLAMFAVCFCLVGHVNAEAAYLKPINSNGAFDVAVKPGETIHVLVPVKATDDSFVIFSTSGKCDTSDYRISNVKITDSKEYVPESVSIEAIDIQYGRTYTVQFDLFVSENAKIGYHTIDISGSSWFFDEEGQREVDLCSITAYTSSERSPAEIVVESCKYDEAMVLPEKNFTMKIKLKNVGELQALNAYVTLNFGDMGIVPDYQMEKIKLGNFMPGEEKSIEVPVKVLKSATPGFNSFTVSVDAKDALGTELKTFSQTLYITINEKKEVVDNRAPKIKISTEDNYMELVPDTDDEIRVKLKNEGEKDATGVKVSVKDGLGASIGLTKAYTSNYIEVGNIEAGKEKIVKIPVNVAKNFAAGLYELEIEAQYADIEGKAMTPANMTMYVKGPVSETVDVTINNTVTISDVSQSPASPRAGETVTVSFKVANAGNAPVDNVRVFGTGLSSQGFEPVSSEPFQNIGTIPANGSVKISMKFKVGADIPAGFNALNLGYTYTDANKHSYDGEVTVYVLNVINNKKESTETVISRPKLIINNSYTDVEILRAGGTFDFTFDLKNTHATKSAKNIKVTISQADGVFAPTKGSNIVYIDEIGPKETVTNTINLKTRGDVITGDYSLTIKVEYEYDDMTEADQEHGGVSDENEIKLHALENYRPVIENISLDTWNGVTVGNPVDLSFEFYNMGKSTLGNVYVTVEGDFELANNSAMSYVGAVNGYSQEFVSPQVVPLVEGEATGILVVHFEDSNGDEVTLSQEFSAYVDGGFGGMEGGYEEWGGEYGEEYGGEYGGEYGEEWGGEYGEEGQEEGFSFLGLTLIPFICVCAGVVLVIVVVIVIIVKKKKSAYDEDDDE